jgi:glycosyltransferase involved in cell wall biosynthesis
MQKVNFDYQIIVSDNNSNDGSVEIIKEYAKKYNQIKTIFTDEKGCGIVDNTIRENEAFPKTEYFTYLDSDDYWTKDDHMQNAYDFFETHPDFSMYITNAMRIYEGGKSPHKPQSYFDPHIKSYDFDKSCMANGKILIPQTSCVIFRRSKREDEFCQTIKDSLHTIHEHSFGYDTARFFMHLTDGKVRYENRVDSVYRIHYNGSFWSSTSQISRDIIHMQLFLDFSNYFTKYEQGNFINDWCCGYFVQTCSTIKNLINSDKLDPLVLPIFFNSIKELNALKVDIWTWLDQMRKEREDICSRKFKKANLKDRLRLKVYNALSEKLKAKDLISQDKQPTVSPNNAPSNFADRIFIAQKILNYNSNTNGEYVSLCVPCVYFIFLQAMNWLKYEIAKDDISSAFEAFKEVVNTLIQNKKFLVYAMQFDPTQIWTIRRKLSLGDKLMIKMYAKLKKMLLRKELIYENL